MSFLKVLLCYNTKLYICQDSIRIYDISAGTGIPVLYTKYKLQCAHIIILFYLIKLYVNYCADNII